MTRAVFWALFPALLAVPGWAGEIEIEADDCRRLVAYRPAADVEYRPGVDVHGRAVAPADLPGSARIDPPETLVLDIGIDLEEKYGLGSGGSYTGEGRVGLVTVEDGQVYFNGVLIGDAEAHAIAEACSRRLEENP